MKLTDWLSKLNTKPARRSRVRSAVVTETLELKALLSVTTGFDSSNGELEIRSNADDEIVVTSSADSTDVLINGESTGISPADVRILEVKGGPLANRIDISGVSTSVFTSLIEVELKGNAGDDTLVGSELDDEIKGGEGDDQIDGGDGHDELKGDGGNDTLVGGDGDDSLTGREGDDSLDGGDGDDTIGAGGDDDTVVGGIGDDSIRAGSGHDSVTGDAGDDSITGGRGRDSLGGSDGDDTIAGQNGSDVITGGDGNDQLRGNRGKDQLSGDAGADSLKGGSSDDLLKGGDDDDTLDGGRGDDLLDGDDGDDEERRGFSTDLESTFYAPLVGVNGEAKFEQDVEGDIELEFELEIEDAAPGTYDVDIDGVAIGQITVDAAGDGRLEYSTEPDDDGEEQLPADFPTIVAGSVITISGLGSGTFAQFEDTELKTDLTPINGSGATGEVEYEADGLERKFKFEAEDVTSGTYDLIVDGIVVDTFVIDSDEFKIEYKEDEDGSSFPETFPTLDIGSLIELEGVLTGTL